MKAATARVKVQVATGLRNNIQRSSDRSSREARGSSNLRLGIYKFAAKGGLKSFEWTKSQIADKSSQVARLPESFLTLPHIGKLTLGQKVRTGQVVQFT